MTEIKEKKQSKLAVAAYWLALVLCLVATLVVGAFKVGGYNLAIETEAQTHERMYHASMEAEAEYLHMLEKNLE